MYNLPIVWKTVSEATPTQNRIQFLRVSGPFLPLSVSAPAHHANLLKPVTLAPKRKTHPRTTPRVIENCMAWMPESVWEPQGTRERRRVRESVKILRYFTVYTHTKTLYHQLRRSNAMSAVEESKIAVPSVQVCIQNKRE